MNFIFSENLPKFLATPGIEGVVLHPYLDSVKVPTIGIGTTIYPDGTKVTMNDSPITIEQAFEYTLDHLNKRVLPYLNNNIKVDQNQNQIDAIGSLVYNIGASAFVKSTVLTRINTGSSLDNIKVAWMMWNKAGGKESKGLVNRRNKEFELYTS